MPYIMVVIKVIFRNMRKKKHIILWISLILVVVIFGFVAITFDIRGWASKNIFHPKDKYRNMITKEVLPSQFIVVEATEDIDLLERQIFSLLDNHFALNLRSKDMHLFESNDIAQEFALLEKMRENFLNNLNQFRRELDEVFDNFLVTHKPVSLTSRIAGDWSNAGRVYPINISEDDSNYVYTIELENAKPDKISITIEDRVMRVEVNHFEKRLASVGRTARDMFADGKTFSNFDFKILLPENADFAKSKGIVRDGHLVIMVPKRSQFERQIIRVPIQ